MKKLWWAGRERRIDSCQCRLWGRNDGLKTKRTLREWRREWSWQVRKHNGRWRHRFCRRVKQKVPKSFDIELRDLWIGSTEKRDSSQDLVADTLVKLYAAPICTFSCLSSMMQARIISFVIILIACLPVKQFPLFLQRSLNGNLSPPPLSLIRRIMWEYKDTQCGRSGNRCCCVEVNSRACSPIWEEGKPMENQR